jgi:SAM-dependent methyltransferase
VYAGREEELRTYLERARGRFAVSLTLALELVRPVASPRVLELGAEHWLFTQLLVENGIVPVSAGRRPGIWSENASLRSPHTVRLAWDGGEADLEHHLFDAERDRWPFADGAFDVVLCMEVLEHLTFSPAHLLYEANRVLARGGALLLATPNALAATKLIRLARGRNVHWAYSGYGPTGRHNREWTPAEVETVLRGAGFDVELRTANIAGYETTGLERAAQLAAGALPLHSRRDHVFVTARATRPPSIALPPDLYRSYERERLRAGGVVLPDEGEGPSVPVVGAPSDEPDLRG